MEEEIDEEIELEKVSKEKNIEPKKPVKQKVVCDFKSLDEMVTQFLLHKVFLSSSAAVDKPNCSLVWNSMLLSFQDCRHSSFSLKK